MILRTFRFRVNKREEPRLVGFMRREALALLKRIPGCRAAYFTRSAERNPSAWLRAGGEYLWVTLWRSDAARRAAQRRKDWQEVVQKEESQFFARRAEARHYRVLLKK